jgi:hypothetical protein
MKPIDDHANPLVLKRIRQIRKLEDEHHALDHHWNGLALDARYSDHMFKHHIARLRSIYKHHVSADINVDKNTALEENAKLHMSAVTKLYGIDGIRTQQSDEKSMLRELGWSDDVCVPSHRSSVGNKVKTMMLKAKTAALGSSSSGFNDLQAPGRLTDSDAVFSTRPKKTLRKRCNDPDITEEDVILLGKYRLNENESSVLGDFVSMLRRLGPYDVHSVIEDIMTELKETNSLDAYGGINA